MSVINRVISHVHCEDTLVADFGLRVDFEQVAGGARKRLCAALKIQAVKHMFLAT